VTETPEIAEECGFNLSTEQKIVRGFDGRLYFNGEEPLKPELTYAEKRAEAYPPLVEQLDILYWDKVNGTNLWQSKIAEIKARYPKE
jgi:hypothetical protein